MDWITGHHSNVHSLVLGEVIARGECLILIAFIHRLAATNPRIYGLTLAVGFNGIVGDRKIIPIARCYGEF